MKTGTWSDDEHNMFLEAMKIHDRNWEEVVKMVPTRTVCQVRTHAQKYFYKLEKDKRKAILFGDASLVDLDKPMRLRKRQRIDYIKLNGPEGDIDDSDALCMRIKQCKPKSKQRQSYSLAVKFNQHLQPAIGTTYAIPAVKGVLSPNDFFTSTITPTGMNMNHFSNVVPIANQKITSVQESKTLSHPNFFVVSQPGYPSYSVPMISQAMAMEHNQPSLHMIRSDLKQTDLSTQPLSVAQPPLAYPIQMVQYPVYNNNPRHTPFEYHMMRKESFQNRVVNKSK